jgi:hypothetical protein
MSDPYAASMGYPGSLAYASTSTMPQYRMPDGSYVTDEKLARRAWEVKLAREKAKNG